MAIVGIDLGTTNSLVSVYKDGKAELIPNSFGEYLTPSVVAIDDDGTVIVGKVAKERLISHPDLTASSFKCFMGSDKKISLGEKSYYPYELSSFILRQLKRDAEIYLGEPVEEAVISVPAYFDDNGRAATKTAGELAGLRVERIINEPSAAALAFKNGIDNDDTFLIFDFGGGTLDISIVDIFDNIIEVISVAGDNHLGGDDFNKAIADYFCETNELDLKYLPDEIKQILIKQAELCKIALSTQEQAAMAVNIADNTYSLVIDNQKLLRITAGLFRRIEAPITKALHDARMTVDDISEVILVGGSSNMLLVRKYLESRFNKRVPISIPPDTAVAIGAGIAAGIKERNENIRDMVLTDICPFSLGIAVFNSADYGKAKFSPIIERNTVLPVSVTKIFSTVDENSDSVNIQVAQGENIYFDDNLLLCEFIINVPKGKADIFVTLTYDINGILQVEVSSSKGESEGEKVSKLILNKNNSLSQEEIDKKLKELEAIKIHPRDKDDNKYSIARAERMFAESLGYEREKISFLLENFNLALNSNKNRDIRIAKAELDNYLDYLEFGSNNSFDTLS